MRVIPAPLSVFPIIISISISINNLNCHPDCHQYQHQHQHHHQHQHQHQHHNRHSRADGDTDKSTTDNRQSKIRKFTLTSKPWSRDELIYALSLYFQLPFGRLNASNEEIIRASLILVRTPASVSMKLCNFARFDPAHKARQIKGLQHGGKLDEVIWHEFYGNWDLLAAESFHVGADLSSFRVGADLSRPSGGQVSEPVRRGERRSSDFDSTRPTETTAEIKHRIGQDFFRGLLLSNFNHSCAITGIAKSSSFQRKLESSLCASHIIPWLHDETKRLNPSNGLCLSAIHDRAFDKGYITLDENLRLMVANGLRQAAKHNPVLKRCFTQYEGEQIATPERFELDREGLEIHCRVYFN